MQFQGNGGGGYVLRCGVFKESGGGGGGEAKIWLFVKMCYN